MEWLSLAGIKGFFKAAWPFILAATVGLVLLLTYCEGRKAGTSARDLQRERGNVTSLEPKGRADEHAAGRRLIDADRLRTEEQGLKGVRHEGQNPTERRLARHRCLRAQQSARAAGRPAPACG